MSKVNLDGLFHIKTAQLIQVQQKNCYTNSEYHLHTLHSRIQPPALADKNPYNICQSDV